MSKIELQNKRHICLEAILYMAELVGMPKERARTEMMSVLGIKGNIKKGNIIAVMLFGSPEKTEYTLRTSRFKIADIVYEKIKPFTQQAITENG